MMGKKLKHPPRYKPLPTPRGIEDVLEQLHWVTLHMKTVAIHMEYFGGFSPIAVIGKLLLKEGHKYKEIYFELLEELAHRE